MGRVLAGLLTAVLVWSAPMTAAATPTAHDFSFTSIDGEPMPLAGYAGKALLVVNTASRCGFTYQYENLQGLWERYRDQGLVVIGVPSNDFGGQEPGSEAEIKHFCSVNFAVDFPMTEKTAVRGGKAHPFYRWAVEQGAEAPGWNFHKYLIAPDGTLAATFATGVEPTSERVVDAVEEVLSR